MNNNRKVILCLNMIVKNEGKIITRLLESISNIIDCYCICDTGSTDGTHKIIKKYFDKRNIPGKILHEPFQNFEHNRNVALKGCETLDDVGIDLDNAYALLLDADMMLEIKPEFNKNHLILDYYRLYQTNGGYTYPNTRIVKINKKFRYHGVTHEYVDTPNGVGKDLRTLHINDKDDGGSKHDKTNRDIKLLEEGLQKEPNNDRYMFYLANSYWDKGQHAKAIDMYRKRIGAGGFWEEIWYSHYRIGLCYNSMGKTEGQPGGDFPRALDAWLEAYNYNTGRTENIYEIVKHYRIHSKHHLAYEFYKLGKRTPYPQNCALFIVNATYDYMFDYEYSIFSYYIKDKVSAESILSCFDKLLNKDIGYYNNVLENYKFSVPHIVNINNNKIDISNELEHDIGQLVSSTPTIVKNENNYILNLRYVSHRIDENGNYINKDKIVTVNEYCELDKNFNFMKRKKFKNQDNLDDSYYIGMEDVRLFKFKDKLYYSGVGQNDNHLVKVSIDEYKPISSENKKEYIYRNFITYKNERDVEKNWVLFDNNGEMNVIYEWYPLTIGKINDDNELIVTDKKDMPFIFKNMRGSTNGIIINDEIWFLCHLVSYESRRHYYHCIVVLNKKTLELKKRSILFTFEGSPVEYCLGFIEDGNNFVFTYSIMDKNSYIYKVNKEELVGKIMR